MSRWVTTSYEALDGVPPVPGVFVAFASDIPVYAGSSLNMKRKLCAYRFDNVQSNWTTIKYSVSIKVGDWLYRAFRLKAKLEASKTCSYSWNHLRQLSVPERKPKSHHQADATHKHRNAFHAAFHKMQKLREEGFKWSEIATILNRMGMKTRHGKTWNAANTRMANRLCPAYPV